MGLGGVSCSVSVGQHIGASWSSHNGIMCHPLCIIILKVRSCNVPEELETAALRAQSKNIY